MSHDSEHQFEVRPNAKFLHIHHVQSGEYVGAMWKDSTPEGLDIVLNLATAAYFSGIEQKGVVFGRLPERVISICRRANQLGMRHGLKAKRGK